jgi:four helix bundle protein
MFISNETFMKKRNEVLELSFEFALNIISYSELLEEKRKYVIARQLLKAGTSIGANIREAQSCESKADFIHKLKISHKEAEETDYWLLLSEKAEKYPNPNVEMKAMLLSIQKLLTKIISTTRKYKS